MRRIRSLAFIMVSLIFLATVLGSVGTETVRADDKIPNRIDEVEHYSYEGKLKNVEDTFALRCYHAGDSYNFTVPGDLKGQRFSWSYNIKTRKVYNRKHHPDDTVAHTMHMNVTDQNGDKLFSYNETGLGGGRTYGLDLTNVSSVNISVQDSPEAGYIHTFFKPMEALGDYLKRSQNFSFKTHTMTYNLYGAGLSMRPVDGVKKFVRIHLKTDTPVRAYIFSDYRFFVLNFDEDLTTQKTLDIKYKDSGRYVLSAYMTLVTKEGYNGTVNATLKGTIEGGTFDLSPIIVGLIIGGMMIATMAVIWYYQKS